MTSTERMGTNVWFTIKESFENHIRLEESKEIDSPNSIKEDNESQFNIVDSTYFAPKSQKVLSFKANSCDISLKNIKAL